MAEFYQQNSRYIPHKGSRLPSFVIALFIQLFLGLMLLRMGVVPEEITEPFEGLTVISMSPPALENEELPRPEPKRNAGGSSEKTEQRRKPLQVAQAASKPVSRPKTLFKSEPVKILQDNPGITPDSSLIDSIGKASIGNRQPGSGTGNPGRGIGNGVGDGIGNGFGPGFEIKPARWVRPLNYYQLRRLYPRTALAEKTAGVVDLICYVKLNRRVRTCDVETESPAGKGFGQASLKASKKFRIFPRKIDGKPVDGAPVLVRVYFDPVPIDRYGGRTEPYSRNDPK